MKLFTSNVLGRETLSLKAEEIESVKQGRIPKHIAICMDGNRRWAKNRFLPTVVGHWKGADCISKVVRGASQLGVKVLTLYAFSTENWNRSEREVSELMKVFIHYLRKNKDFMIEEGVRLDCIGDLSKLPSDVQQVFYETKQATSQGSVIELVLAVNYGGRDDLKRAVYRIVNDCELGLLDKKNITETLISSYLDTAQWNDPELFIRTSGEQRLSNFLLWQFSYTEVYITKTLWPDFNEKHLLEAVVEFQQRDRRLGGS